MKLLTLWFVVLFCVFLAGNSKAQEDTVQHISDSLTVDTLNIKSSKPQRMFLYEDSTGISKPARAALLSAAFPGLGQIYTKKLWHIRLPIIYGLGGFMGYLINKDHKKYVELRNAYLYALDNNPITDPDPKFSGYNAQSLKRNRDNYRRNRDYYVILSIGVYVLNIAEAATMAHLNGFDVSDDLAFSIKPKFQVIQGETVTGLALAVPIGSRRKFNLQKKRLQKYKIW